MLDGVFSCDMVGPVLSEKEVSWIFMLYRNSWSFISWAAVIQYLHVSMPLQSSQWFHFQFQMS